MTTKQQIQTKLEEAGIKTLYDLDKYRQERATSKYEALSRYETLCGLIGTDAANIILHHFLEYQTGMMELENLLFLFEEVTQENTK